MPEHAHHKSFLFSWCLRLGPGRTLLFDALAWLALGLVPEEEQVKLGSRRLDGRGLVGLQPPQWSPGPNRCGAHEASTEAGCSPPCSSLPSCAPRGPLVP